MDEVIGITELYRQGVVVPASREAVDRLSRGGARSDGSDAATHVALSDDAAPLWVHGFFDAVNSACGTALGEHEEEAMEGEQLARLWQVVQKHITRFDDPRREFLERLLDAIVLAEREGVPLFWVL